MQDEIAPQKLGTRLSVAALAVVVVASCFSPLMAERAELTAVACHDIVLRDDDDELPHIQAYCRSSWRNSRIRRDDWDDCTQEVFARLYGAMSKAEILTAIKDSDSAARRELNRAVWATAQRWRRQRPHRSLPEFGDAEPALKSESWLEVTQLLEMVRSAIHDDRARLNPIQRSIMAQAESGVGVSEIAAQLGLSAERVSDEKYKAIRKLRAYFEVV